MRTIDIPQEWQNILKQIQVEFPGSIIAGGALRDLFNDKPIKDVDIFVPTNDPESASRVIERLFTGEDIELDSTNIYGVNGDEDDRDLYAVYKLGRSAWDYDIILCSPSATDIRSFDINICQIVYDGSNIDRTGEYHYGIFNRILKVVNVNRTDRNAQRLERLHEKYPEFTIQGELDDDIPF